MVDIRQFFGDPNSSKKSTIRLANFIKAKTSTTKRAVGSKQKHQDVDDSEAENPSKRAKRDTGSLVSTKSSPTKTKRGKVEYVDLDSDSESNNHDEPIDVDTADNHSNSAVKKRKVSEKASSAHRKGPKEPSPTMASKDKKTQSQVKGASADEILADIPDADLPEVGETEGKFNYFQSKAQAPQPTNNDVEIPEAAPNCLSGLTIVFTGVLPNMDRDTSENVAKKYGAKVTKSISGKTSLVVIGEDAGPSKVKKIQSLKVKAVNEDGFLELLRRMPSEGGDGEAALKAKTKREEEERKIMEDAKAEAKKEKEEELKKQKANESKSSNSSPGSLQKERVIPNDEKLWTVRYAPNSITQLCGNKGQVQKLQRWLENWFDNAKQGFKNPGPDGSGIYRACLISGPPGIGKTSAAHLVARNLGFDVLEKNASDVRSKSLLNRDIKSVLNNTSVVGFFKHRGDEHHGHENDKKFCLIMDEVDGMSSGDHGGAGALSSFCKITHMPMILICNDKSLPKMRTFDRNTFDLPFRRPSENEVKSRLMTIALREKIKLDPTVISQLIQATHNDIRQMINLLSTVSMTQKTIGHAQAKDITKSWNKQTVLKPFDITARLLNGQLYNANAHHSLNDKIDLYFNDIDFTPLMIQENYIATRPVNCNSPLDHLKRVANAADDISQSDQINSLIRSSEQQWSLLPFHAVMSSVKPSSEVAGTVTQRINFASWLGQNSKALKYERYLQELQYHMRLRTSSDKPELRMGYIPLLIVKLSQYLIHDHEKGIDEVIRLMDDYYLTKEDFDNIIDFGIGPLKSETTLKKVPAKIKTAFTRKYNAATHPVAIYRAGSTVGSGTSKKQKVDFDDVIEDDTLRDDDDEIDQDSDKIDTKKDKLIKEVKPKKVPKKKAKALK
ncbi:uncharacterized protein PRCAT00004146001 [Priceomyces carsonii]|uniref:uncharacterized protein n=1 Tax=Priceomyces carsonii TaxID=28549 RepID=UPI002EDA2A7F|nr:unnamed protein product [Priceomyces carsonii]